MARLVPVSRLAPSSVSRNLPERLDPLDDHQQIVAAESEHGIDQIVPRALLPEMHLEPVGEEGKKSRQYCRTSVVSLHGDTLPSRSRAR